MCCPRCGTHIVLDPISKSIDLGCYKSKWGETPKECFRCKGCGLARPDAWWLALELDVNTEITFPEEVVQEMPEELAGLREAPFGD
jgi:NMD protein affecting ribosome stability and mRNA decay